MIDLFLSTPFSNIVFIGGHLYPTQRLAKLQKLLSLGVVMFTHPCTWLTVNGLGTPVKLLFLVAGENFLLSVMLRQRESSILNK